MTTKQGRPQQTVLKHLMLLQLLLRLHLQQQQRQLGHSKPHIQKQHRTGWTTAAAAAAQTTNVPAKQLPTRPGKTLHTSLAAPQQNPRPRLLAGKC